MFSTTITSTGTLANDVPINGAANPWECHEYIHQIQFEEDENFLEHIEWYAEGYLPEGVSLDYEIGLLSGKVKPFNEQPACQDLIGGKEKLKYDGSNFDKIGRLQDTSFDFEFTINRLYVAIDETFPTEEQSTLYPDYLESLELFNTEQLIYNKNGFRIISLSEENQQLLLDDADAILDTPPEGSYLENRVILEKDSSYTICLLELVSESVSIKEIKNHDIDNYIFAKEYLEAYSTMFLPEQKGDEKPKEVEIFHSFKIGNKKYTKENFEEYLNDHPGPFDICES